MENPSINLLCMSAIGNFQMRGSGTIVRACRFGMLFHLCRPVVDKGEGYRGCDPLFSFPFLCIQFGIPCFVFVGWVITGMYHG